jgi:hypothetical protein
MRTSHYPAPGGVCGSGEQSSSCPAVVRSRIFIRSAWPTVVDASDRNRYNRGTRVCLCELRINIDQRKDIHDKQRRLIDGITLCFLSGRPVSTRLSRECTRISLSTRTSPGTGSSTIRADAELVLPRRESNWTCRRVRRGARGFGRAMSSISAKRGREPHLIGTDGGAQDVHTVRVEGGRSGLPPRGVR